MNILLVTDSYPPEIRSASHLMLELANELKARNHCVTVITSWPQYNLDAEASKSEASEFCQENGVSVIRVKTLPHHNVNYIVRGISQLLMPWQFLFKLKKYAKHKFDAVVVYSPPLPLALVGSWLKWKGAKYLLNVQDIFPQNAIDLKLLKNKLLISFFQKLEHFSYKTAGCVTFHSEKNCELLREKFPYLQRRMQVLHNWVDTEHFKTVAAKNFRDLFKLENKIVALFAGVMGPSQYLELILKVAERVSDVKELVFLLVGEGAEKAKLQAMAQEMKLTNVVFHSFISREEYPALVKACDIGLICLSPDNTTPVVPGKLLGYMAAGLPVAAFLNLASDGHSIIQDAQCGYSAVSSNVEEAVTLMRRLIDERKNFSELGESGRYYVTQHFSQQRCVDQLETLLGNC